uniref:Putative secreted protein n=1 Tax=Ixodes ricinus TaxID=34613 RepID=A0A6B0TRF0_IXORI
MSLVVQMLAVATLLPALAPMYGIPSSRHRSRIASATFVSYSVRRSLKVFPPPIKMPWACFTAATGSGAS